MQMASAAPDVLAAVLGVGPQSNQWPSQGGYEHKGHH